MADTGQESELLFFETFSHENAEELNLDLVQFPRPVVITEIRVVPLQTRVQADVRGGERLGATNPSSFKLEMFVNNLSRPNASTFEMLGLLDYKANLEIQLLTEVKIPTDGLILKGWYKTLTIAIYGVLTNISVEQESLPPPPPPQPRKQAVPVPQVAPLPVSQPTGQSHRSEIQDWEAVTQKLVTSHTPHTTQHPLDYIQQQLQQANIQSVSHSVSSSLQPHPVMAVTHPLPAPGQMPHQLNVPVQMPHQLPVPVQMPHPGLPLAPIKQEPVYTPDDYSRRIMEKELLSPGSGRDVKPEPKDMYEDSRSRDSWGYDNRGSRERPTEGRDYPSDSREGSRDRDRDRDSRDSREREYRESREYRDDWDKGRDKDRDRDRDKKRDFDRDRDSKERDRRGYDDKDRGGRGYEGRDSREGRDGRDSKYDSKADRDGDPDRDRERGYDRERDADMDRDRERDRGRDYDRNREFDRDRTRDSREPGRERDNFREMDRSRDREMDRGREKEAERGREREIERGREREREGDRGKEIDKGRDKSQQDRDSDREWEGERGVRVEREMDKGIRGREMDRSVERVRDIREKDNRTDSRGFRDRTRDDYRKMERPREVYMETEAPRSPSRSRSRSFSPDQVSSHSPSPHIPTVEPRPRISPVRITERGYPRRPARECQNPEVLKVVKEVVLEEPMSPSPDEDAPADSESPGLPFESMSPDNLGSPMEQAYMSDYEAISSEDEFIEIESDLRFSKRYPFMRRRRGSGIDYEVDEEAFSWITTPFNPYQFEALPLVTFSDVAATPFEQAKARYLRGDYVKPATRPLEAQQLLDIVEKYKTTDHYDSWVEAMESVPALLPLGLSYLLYKERNSDVLGHLIQWMVEGLDEKQATAQPASAYKVRHLKMGFKLAAALCSCDADVAVKVLQENVQQKLLDNFQSQFMSFSLKLQIVAALDQTTRLKDGIEWFLGNHALQSSRSDFAQLSCYQVTVKCLLQKQVVRVVVAMTALVKKIHTYEVMNKLSQQVHRIVDNSPFLSEQKAPGEEGEDSEMETLTQVVTESDVDAMATCVEEITKVFTLANTLVAQPGRTLPGKAMFDVKPVPIDPYPGLFHIANAKQLLESLLFLISCPSTACIPSLFGGVRNLLHQWLSTQDGLRYLASRSEVTNKIVQALMQMADYNRDEVADENAVQQLVLELIFKLQTLAYVDKLYDYNNQPMRTVFEDQLPITVLHTLYTMTFSLLGRTSVVQVLSYDNNIQCLLPFVEQTGNEGDDARLKKSVCSGYATELLNIVVHYSDNITFLERHGNMLLGLGESDFTSKLNRLKEWLAPVKSIPSFNVESLSSIMEQLKSHADDIQKLPRGLITILRVLKHLAIPPANDYPDDKADPMKHKYILLELFSGDCFPIFVNILQKLSDLMLRPWQKGVPRSMEVLSLYLSLIRPCLEMIKVTTQYLIMARGTEFRDLTTLPVLFDLHTVLCSVPASTIYIPEIQAIQRDIIDTVAAYTQPVSDVAEGGGDKINQSLWTLAIRDLLKFTMKAPYTYLSGLLILSELLPLPLPLQTKEPLSPEESSLALNTRKLWSAHLLPLHGALHNIICTLAVTSCQPLQQILRKICWQMSDLAAPTATMITQCLLDILLEHIESGQIDNKDGRPGMETDDPKVALASRGRVLNLLSYLLSQPAIKCTMLRLMGSGGEDRYQDVLSQLLSILNEVTDRPEHVQDQECIVSILQSWFDTEITLTSGETTLSLPQQVANALPTPDQLTLSIKALLDHISQQSYKYDTVLPCVRALVMLTEHDYSFHLIKLAFSKHKMALFQLLQRIQSNFSKDSSDCLSTFSTTLEFLRLLITVDPPVADLPLTRTITLTNQELRQIVNWDPDVPDHPLVDLQKHLEDCVKEEETLDSLLDSVNSLLTVLKRDSPQKTQPEPPPPTLPEPESLISLFNIRSTYTITDPDDERLNATFWQTTFEPDDPDLVPCDLDAICKKYCHDFNLEEELKKDSMTSEEELTKPKKLKDRRKSQEYVSGIGGGMRRPFVAPMRGRGIARGLAAHGNRHDPFRSRPPNTSRPPSMHVDDFMKLEKSSASREESPSSTGGGIRREGPDFQRGRGGRGFDRGRGGFDRGRGGRFMTPPGTFRREPGGFRGVSDVGDFGSLYSGRAKPSFINPRSFNTRGHERTISGDHRDVRGGRFEPRGGRGPWSRGPGWPMPRFKDDRFAQGLGGGGGGPSFRGNRTDPGRHQRSFTK